VTAQPSRRRYRMVARAEKRDQTRRKIVQAMKDAIMTSAYPSIRIADVAGTAGVSSQTVHTHFASKEALFLAAIGELGQELLEMRGGTPPGDVVAIARGLVAEYERYGDVNWALLPLERDSTAVAAALQAGRAGHRAWLEASFAPLLPVHPRRRRQALDALYAATDVGTWKLLRRDLGLSSARTRAVIETLVRGALTACDDSH
jgi:AcrR family transcriptional regulator